MKRADRRAKKAASRRLGGERSARGEERALAQPAVDDLERHGQASLDVRQDQRRCEEQRRAPPVDAVVPHDLVVRRRRQQPTSRRQLALPE